MTDAPKKRPRFQIHLSTAIWLMIAASLLLGLIIGCGQWFGAMHEKLYYKNVAQRCLVQMRAQADVKAIRQWFKAHANDAELKDRPECITKLRFDGMECDYFKNDGRLYMIWGSGFGHWGLVVGPADMPTPPSDPRSCILPMEPGAYVWHEIQ